MFGYEFKKFLILEWTTRNRFLKINQKNKYDLSPENVLATVFRPLVLFVRTK